jgi:transcriptional regulator with XRE-family HTH domain
MEYLVRLKELRNEFGKTQKEIAEYLNIKQNTYSQYENGQRQLPIDILIKLSFYYDVSVDYILNITDIETRYNKKY